MPTGLSSTTQPEIALVATALAWRFLFRVFVATESVGGSFLRLVVVVVSRSRATSGVRKNFSIRGALSNRVERKRTPA